MKARDFMPAVKMGAKWYPQDLAGIVGQPNVGNVFYLDADNGSDSNNGRSWKSAFKTLTAAEDACVTNNYDVIIVAPSGTSGTAETATITWDKNHITVIGAAAPTMCGQRSRIVWTVDETDPCLTISGHSNRFLNVKWGTESASNDVLVNMTGDRNYFNNVHFAGICHATAGDDATARCLTLTGSHENTFDSCMIGEDSIQRSAANANLDLAIASKNTFNDCMFLMAADSNTALHVVSTGTTGASGWNRFNDCTFYNKWTNAADKIVAVFDISAQTQTCDILMTGSNLAVGADDWEATASGHLWFPQLQDTNPGTYAGLAINNVV